jgi:hypothetical protein
VMASGPDLSYQWYKAPSNTVIGTGSTLEIAADETGYYWAYVSTPCGAANTAYAQVSVYPTIEQQPVGTIVNRGATAQLQVAAAGSYLQYQWYRNDYAYPVGTNSPVLQTPPAQEDAFYFCLVSSGAASTRSANASVRLCTPPSVSGPEVAPLTGGCKLLSVTLPDHEQGNVSYAWYRGTVGDTSSAPLSMSRSFQLCPTAPAQYWCRVTNMDTGCTKDTDAINVMP